MQKSYLLISIQLTPAAIGQAAVSMNQEAGSPLPRDMLVSTRHSMHLGNLWPFVPGFSKQLVKNTNELLNEFFFSPYTQQKSLLVLRSLSLWALGSMLTFPCLHRVIWKMMLCLEYGKFLRFISCFHICFPVSGAIWRGCEPFMRLSLAGGSRSLWVAHWRLESGCGFCHSLYFLVHHVVNSFCHMSSLPWLELLHYAFPTMVKPNPQKPWAKMNLPFSQAMWSQGCKSN